MADTTPQQGIGQELVFRRPGWALWGFLAAVLALKLAVVWQLKDHTLLSPDAGLDTTAYVNLARRVVAGDVALGPGLYFVAPLYIYFLAAGLWLFDSFTAVRVAQAALGTASVGCIYLMARAWAGPRAAWLAAILAALTGLFTFYETLILQAALDAFLTSAALWLLTPPGNGDRHHLSRGTLAINGASPHVRTALCGVVFALGALNRPNMMFAAAAVVGAMLLFRRWRPAALLVAGMALGFAPSLARNVIVAGEWSLVSSHGGLNLYIGNNERATGFYEPVPGIRPLIEGQQEDARKVASEALGREVSDAEASGYFRGRALSWMAANPMDAAALFVRKLYFTFHAQHVALPHSYPFFAYEMDTALQVLFVGPWLLVPLGLAGLCLVRPLSREYLIWAAFVPGYAVGVALFFVAERYRMPLLVPLCVGAGAALDHVWRAIAAKRARALALPLAAVAVLAVAVNWRFPLNDGRWDDGLRTAQRLVITGHYDEADAWVERLERAAPRPGRAHHGVGLQLVMQDQPERALKHLKKSLERGFVAPDDVEMWLRMGRVSSRSEGPAAAEPFFRRAVQLAPDQASARQQYGLNLLLLGRHEDARRELAEAVRLDPDDVDSLAHLAYAEVQLGDADAARRHVRAALARQPDHTLTRQLAAALGIGEVRP
ncbi:MAG TPA: tetratricopeptide repeat protein [Vicinamibacterales bacterium]